MYADVRCIYVHMCMFRRLVFYWCVWYDDGMERIAPIIYVTCEIVRYQIRINLPRIDRSEIELQLKRKANKWGMVAMIYDDI